MFDKLLPKNINELSPLTLAYIGDAVFEIYMRIMIVDKKRGNVEVLHNEVTKYVNATTQSEMAKKILPLLNDDEAAVFRRGRNTKLHQAPKNSSNADYHYATGFEALIGYLFVKNNIQRLEELISFIL